MYTELSVKEEFSPHTQQNVHKTSFPFVESPKNESPIDFPSFHHLSDVENSKDVSDSDTCNAQALYSCFFFDEFVCLPNVHLFFRAILYPAGSYNFERLN